MDFSEHLDSVLNANESLDVHCAVLFERNVRLTLTRSRTFQYYPCRYVRTSCHFNKRSEYSMPFDTISYLIINGMYTFIIYTFLFIIVRLIPHFMTFPKFLSLTIVSLQPNPQSTKR